MQFKSYKTEIVMASPVNVNVIFNNKSLRR